jgi:excinuclease ABC subunit C
MFYRHGKLLSTFETIIKDRMPDTLINYIKQFYQSNIIPNEIHIDSTYLRAVELNIKVVNPKISEGKKVVEMATKNARDNFEHKLNIFKQREAKSSEAIKKLGLLLNIKTPKYIIMIDNSVTNNDEPVSGLVVYRNGIKQKHEYRKYNLISRDRKADVDYMQQVFLRY